MFLLYANFGKSIDKFSKVQVKLIICIGEIKNMYTALGVRIGTEEDSKALNMEKLRYHKIIIMCDVTIYCVTNA